VPEQPCREPGATSLRQAASAVADGVGSLCRLTLGPQDRLRGPADVSDVVAGVWVAVSLLPQLFGQLAAFLEVENVKGAVSHGRGTGAAGRVRAVSDALHRAGLDADAMAVALDAAHEACAGLQTATGVTAG